MSGAENCHPGKIDCTTSKPCATPVEALQQCFLVRARSWRDSEPENDLRLYAWLGETRERKCIAEFGEVVYRAVLKYPQIGAYTLYSAQIVRFVKPILRPTGISPRASRICLTAAVTRYASSSSKEESREGNGAIWHPVSRVANVSAAIACISICVSILPSIVTTSCVRLGSIFEREPISAGICEPITPAHE